MEENQFTSWLTKEQYSALNQEFTKLYSRFKEDLAEWIEKAGGKDRVKIELKNNDIFDLFLVFSESPQNINTASEN